ncbi:transcriptional regulator, partial [Aeromonas salmonicida subsp. salmonicida]
MANIKEVAARAEVSTTTVSHVINETRFVAQETRERVFAAMRELNYAPSLVARSLKVKETNSIGMLVTTSSNPFFAEVVRG